MFTNNRCKQRIKHIQVIFVRKIICVGAQINFRIEFSKILSFSAASLKFKRKNGEHGDGDAQTEYTDEAGGVRRPPQFGRIGWVGRPLLAAFLADLCRVALLSRVHSRIRRFFIRRASEDPKGSHTLVFAPVL